MAQALQVWKQNEEELRFPVSSNGQMTDRLIAPEGSMSRLTLEGLQFTDTWGAHFIMTEKKYRTPLTIETVIRTDSTNIRLAYGELGRVILNWDRKEDILKLKHPVTGQDFSFPGKGEVSLHEWIHVQWIIAEGQMRLVVNHEERFAVAGNFRGLLGKAGVWTSWRANVTVQSFSISEHWPAGETGSSESADSKKLAGLHYGTSGISYIGCLEGCLRYLNRYPSEAVLLAGTGHALRSDLPGGGAGAADRLDHGLLQRLGPHLGLKLVGLWDDSFLLPDDTERLSVLKDKVRDAIGRGLPCFGKGLDGHGYTVFTGYDQQGCSFIGLKGIDYCRWEGLTQVEMIYAVEPVQMSGSGYRPFHKPEGPKREMVLEVLTAAVDQAMHTNAAQGYDRWAAQWGSAAAVETAALKESIRACADARTAAAAFLKQARLSVREALAADFEHAAQRYEAAAGSLQSLIAMQEQPESNGQSASKLLDAAKQAEAEGLNTIRRIVTVMQNTKILEGLSNQGNSNDSQINAFKGILDYLQVPCSLAWVYGATGRAFMFTVHERINVDPVHLVHPHHKIRELFAHIGAATGGIDAYAEGERYTSLLKQAHELAKTSIDSGRPCFGRGIDFEGVEHSIVVGYAPDGYYTACWHQSAGGVIPWNMLGLAQCPCEPCSSLRQDWKRPGPLKGTCLCDDCRSRLEIGRRDVPRTQGQVDLQWVDRAEPADVRTTLREVLRYAALYNSADNPWAVEGQKTGLEAYDVWIRALEKHSADGWYVGCYSEGWRGQRHSAWQFLLEARKRLEGSYQELDELIAHTEKLNRLFGAFGDMFPWMQPFGPIPDAERRYAGAELLKEAKQVEAEALLAMSKTVTALE